MCCSLGCVSTIIKQATKRLDKPSTIHRREFLGEPINDDEIIGLEHPIDCINKDEIPPNELLDQIKIEGSTSLKKALRALCEEFKDIFSTTVRNVPAAIPTMDIEVDMTKWRNKANKLAPRIHSPEKQKEILKQLKILLDLDIIEISTASEWSQVHMVPKPTSPGEWRLTIDFVKLNECTIGKVGPLRL